MRNHILAAALHIAAGNPLDPTLNVKTGTAPPVVGANVVTILDWIAWTACAACVAGVLIVAGTMAIKHQRGEAGQHVSGLGWVLGGCILIGAAFALVGAFA
jgi:hypothetical protein